MPLLKPVRAIQLNKSCGLARGLVGYWLLAEGTGQKVADLSRYGNTGTLCGNTFWVSGKFGSALNFDGTGDYVDCGNGNSLKITGPLTICGWVKPDNLTGSKVIASRYKTTGNQRAYMLMVSNNKVAFWIDPYGDYTNIKTVTSVKTIDTNWHYVVGRYDGTNMNIFIDGIKDSATNTVSAIYASSANNRIGAYDSGYFFTGKIDHIMIYNRALSTAEIELLYREPFCMFVVTIQPSLLFPAGQLVLLTAALTATSSVYGSLTKHSKLAGIIDAAAALSGILTWLYRGPAERQWLIEALFNGMTANAFKLGTVVTFGWFWMRRSGCSALYRGPGMERMDFANILAVAEQHATSISPPDYIPHYSNSTYFYVIRRFNICGYQERTLTAAVKVAIDAQGNLPKPQPNNIFAWRLEQVCGNKIQLIWFYCPLEQESKPESFRIYYDGGTGLVDYENPIAAISYRGWKFYTYQSDSLTAGRYLFAVRVEDAAGVENNSLAQLPIQLATGSPDSIEILSVQNA